MNRGLPPASQPGRAVAAPSVAETIRVAVFLLLAWSLVGPSPARAGSLFAADGLGLPRRGYDLAARGAGGTGAGVVDSYAMSAVNPGALGWITRPQIHVGLTTENVWLRTAESGTSDRVGGTSISGLRAALPWPGRLRLAAGYHSVTDGRYSIESRLAAGRPDEHVRRYLGTGGIGGLYIEAAFPLANRLTLGARHAWIGGTLREERRDTFAGSEFTDTESVLRTRLESGREFVLGFQARPLDAVSFGAFLGRGTESDLKSLFLSSSGVRSEERLGFDLPPTYGGGVAYTFRSRWQVAFDYTTTLWSESATSQGPGAGSTAFDRLSDDRHLGFGLRRLASLEPRARASERTVWRAGFRWDELGLPERAEPIREWAVSGGVGLPVQIDRGYLDVLLELGRRGDDAEVGLRETFLELGFGVTFQELARRF